MAGRTNFNMDMTEIIEDRKRVAASKPKRMTSEKEQELIAQKKRIADKKFNLEIAAIKNSKFA